MDKLRNCRGETLVETLAAILIVSLASVVLMTMTVTTVRITRVTREADRAFQAEIEAAEAQRPGGGVGSVTIQVDGGASYTHPVALYRVTGGEDGAPLTSYAVKEGAP